MDQPEILIVGAGPTGLTAALELARRGVCVRIIDEKSGPTPLSKAVGIAPASLDLLEPSGVTERLLHEGTPIERIEIHLHRTWLGAIHLDELRHRFNFLLSLPQSETETIMARSLRDNGVDIEWGARLVGLDATDDGAFAHVEMAQRRASARYRYVYGADGADSRVRREIGLTFEGCTHQRLWSIADVELDDWPHLNNHAQVFLHKGGDVGFIIAIGLDCYRAISNTADAMAHIGGDYVIRRILRTDTFHVPARQVNHYRVGNVFLGGDAAHAHSPLGARGMNLGIEDAASFAQCLADDTLDGYDHERRPIAERWIKLSETLLSAVQATDPLKELARNLALFLVGHVPPLQRPILKRVAGLKE